MINPQQMLYEFHTELGDRPGRGDAGLRLKLIREEFREVEAELAPGDSFPVDHRSLARELADLVYVCYGTAHAFNIDLETALREVHCAAMSKVKGPNRPLFRADGKVLKPDGFIPPDMTKAIRGWTNEK